jgi:hypothetical protein
MNFTSVDRSAIVVSTLDGEDDAKQFWWSKTPQERLQALEFMRRVIYGYDPLTARFQRVLEVVEQEPS